MLCFSGLWARATHQLWGRRLLRFPTLPGMILEAWRMLRGSCRSWCRYECDHFWSSCIVSKAVILLFFSIFILVVWKSVFLFIYISLKISTPYEGSTVYFGLLPTTGLVLCPLSVTISNINEIRKSSLFKMASFQSFYRLLQISSVNKMLLLVVWQFIWVALPKTLSIWWRNGVSSQNVTNLQL